MTRYFWQKHFSSVNIFYDVFYALLFIVMASSKVCNTTYKAANYHRRPCNNNSLCTSNSSKGAHALDALLQCRHGIFDFAFIFDHGKTVETIILQGLDESGQIKITLADDSILPAAIAIEGKVFVVHAKHGIAKYFSPFYRIASSL